MASNSKSITLYSSNGKAYYLQAYFNEESTNTPQNSSRIYVEAKLTSTGYRWTSNYNSYLRIYWHDNRENYDRLVAETALTSIDNNGSAYASGYIDPLYHNSDGGLSGYAYATFTKGGTSSYTPNTGGVNTDWTALTAIPRQANVTGYNDFNDEQNPTITYNNPGGFRINARLEFAGTNIKRDNISNTGSYTFDLTDAERKLLRQKCTGNSMTVRGVIATCIGGTTENYWSYWDRTMTIVNGNPTFNNFEFEDVNSTTVALTGNNQNIIKGVSIVEATIPASSKASAKKEATMSKYRFTCGDKAVDIPYSNSEGVSNIIQNITNGTFTVYATDSRGNSTPVTKLANKVIDYSPLTKNSIDVYRSNGVSEEVILKLEGTIDEVNFGVKTNSIILAYYQYSVAGSGEWSEAIQFTPEIKDGKFTYNAVIKGDLASKGFNISNSYEINVMVFDELGGVTFTDTLGSGIPNLALAKNGVGIMGKYDESVGGKGQVAGNPLAYYPIGAIYLSVNSTSPEELFGGTWEQLKDRFLLGAGDTYENGTTGGEKEHTLTVNEMPSHKHNGIYWDGNDNMPLSLNPGTNYPAGYSLPFSYGTNEKDWLQTANAGGNQPHNNMPPYLTVYMWKRIG